MSVGLVVDWSGLDAVQAKLKALDAFETMAVLDDVGALLESQTRRRIHEEKTGPDGKPWTDWSEGYAGRRHGRSKSHPPHPGELRSSGGHSLLELSGDLLDSIMFEVDADGVRVGSNLIYAGAMQDGTDDIPARPYLGLSATNENELMRLVLNFLKGVLTQDALVPA